MKLFKILTGTTLALVLGAGMLAAQGTGHRMDGPKDAGKKAQMQKRPESETPEMKAQRHKATEYRIEMLNLMVKYGKMEKARADFMIKKINNDKAFKDANPEWVKYGRPAMMALACKKGPGAAMKGCPMMGGKGVPGADRRQGPNHQGRPALKHDMRPGSAPDSAADASCEEFED